jgi:uncharacterized protein
MLELHARQRDNLANESRCSPAWRRFGFGRELSAGESDGPQYNPLVIYEWDPAKAADNERKHGVSFDDPDHSANERRFMTIGASTRARLLFVAHVDRGEDRVRIISARVATRGETNAHQERSTKRD